MCTLNNSPYLKIPIDLPSEWKMAVKTKNWQLLDQLTGTYTQSDGHLFKILSRYKSIQSIERIISIRENPDEDGIWHDDGSRTLAFTLSLMEDPSQIKGGELLLRVKNASLKETITIRPQAFGTLLIFKTGVDGYEHKVLRVKKGLRIICAGWCT